MQQEMQRNGLIIMCYNLKFFLTIILLAVTQFCAAQRPKTGIWVTAFAPVHLAKQWQWHNETGYRTLGSSVSPLQYYYRTAVRWNCNEKWNTAAGVAFFFTRTSFIKSNDEFGREFRIWEELIHQLQLNEKLKAMFRFRTEQRFFAETNVKSPYKAYRFRIRPQLTQKISGKWDLQVADEYMQQQKLGALSFDQNRMMLSAIFHINTSMQLQGGYMWLKWPEASQQILTVSFQKNISFHAG